MGKQKQRQTKKPGRPVQEPMHDVDHDGDYPMAQPKRWKGGKRC